MEGLNDLALTIASEYDLVKGESESDVNFLARTIYTLLGRMAYASLWDEQDDYEDGSVAHIKKRVDEILSSYMSIYPELQQYNPEFRMDAPEEIYEIMLNTGQMYHSPFRISPASPAISTYYDVIFTRGLPLNTHQSISGIGSYCKNAVPYSARSVPFQEMFQIQEAQLSRFWKTINQKAEMRPIHSGELMEFLRMKEPFFSGYWVNKPYTDGRRSLARTGMKGNYLYYIYQVLDGTLMGYQLPDWMTNNGNYLQIANAILADAETLPNSTYHLDGELVHVSLGYLFPPAEQYLLKLYSWPSNYNRIKDSYHRVFSSNVFFSIKHYLENLGYIFKEV